MIPYLDLISIPFPIFFFLFFLIWLYFFSYYNYSLQRLYFYSASFFGRFLRWMKSGSRPFFLVFILSGLLLMLHDYLLKLSSSQFIREIDLQQIYSEKVQNQLLDTIRTIRLIQLSDILQAGTFLKILAMSVILLFIYQAIQARKRIHVSPFENLSGDESVSLYLNGLAPSLMGEFSFLTTLYRIIDEAASSRIRGNVIEAGLSIEDIGKALKEVTGGTSVEISFGPIKIPLASILGIIAKLVQGPRLHGLVLREGAKLCMIANISGGGMKGSWKVESPYPSNSESLSQALYSMTEELSYRVFTDLVNIGTKRWRAVRDYTKGLRKYRDTLQMNRQKKILLYEAEKNFLNALREDQAFFACHYNLGIVYRDLGKIEAAEISFRKAIAANPSHTDSFYALALLYRQKKKYDDVILYCKQILKIKLEDAKVWDLLALAMDSLETDLAIADKSKLRDCLYIRRVSVYIAWKYLCRARFRNQKDRVYVETAISCLRNLGLTQKLLSYKKAIYTLQQAVSFNPVESSVYYDYAICLKESSDLDRAREALHTAIGIEDKEDYRIELALIYAALYRKQKKEMLKLENKKAALYCCEISLQFPSRLNEKQLEKLSQVYALIEEPEKKKSLSYIRTANACIENEKVEPLKIYYKTLNHKRHELADEIQKGNRSLALQWAFARLQFQLSRALFRLGQYEKAKSLAEEAIVLLAEKHKKETRELLYYRDLALFSFYLKDFSSAMLYLEHALSLFPDSDKVHLLMGRVFLAMDNLDKAEAEFERAFNHKPNADSLTYIGRIYYIRSETLLDKSERRKAIEKGIEFNHYALDILESDSLISGDSIALLLERGKLHYWLGFLYMKSNRTDQAISHLKIAVNLGAYPHESRSFLGLLFTLNHKYNEAEEILSALLDEMKDKSSDPESMEIYFRSLLYYLIYHSEREIPLKNESKIFHKLETAFTSKKKSDQALFYDVKGWYFIRVKGLLDEGIDEIKKARSLEFDFYSEYHLAFAYYLKVKNGNPAFTPLAEFHCQNAVEADEYGHIQERLNHLKELLEWDIVNPE